jgi:tetratricopeptide (TPR) repeat protein
VLCLLSLGNSKLQISQALGAVQAGEVATAKTLLDKASKAQIDGEPWYLSAMIETSDKDRTNDLYQAANLTPSPKYFRALGRAQTATGDIVGATASYNGALARDPNNLATLLQLVRMFDQTGDKKAAISTAMRLVAVETKPYFQVRSISEYIPTETYEGRIFLASQEKSPTKQIELLKPAVEGFLEYLHITVPVILSYAKQDASLDFLGDNKDSAKRKLELGRDTCNQLIKLYRAAGRPADAGAVVLSRAEFEAGLAGLANESK